MESMYLDESTQEEEDGEHPLFLRNVNESAPQNTFGGYNIDIFLSVHKEFIEKFLCPICLNVPKFAVEAHNHRDTIRNGKKEEVIDACGHIMCKSCATKWVQQHSSTCPVCKKTLKIPHLLPALHIRRLIEQEPIRCVNYEMGCVWKGEIGKNGNKLNEHLEKDCLYVYSSCKYDDDRSHHTLELRKDILEHEKVCPKRLVACKLCSLQIPLNSMDSHLQDFCGHVEVECPNQCYTHYSSPFMLSPSCDFKLNQLIDELYHLKNDTGDNEGQLDIESVKMQKIQKIQQFWESFNEHPLHFCTSIAENTPIHSPGTTKKNTNHIRTKRKRSISASSSKTAPTSSPVVVDSNQFFSVPVNECNDTPFFPNVVLFPKMLRMDLTTHLTRCPLQTVCCPYKNLECDWFGERRSLDAHLKQSSTHHLRLFERIENKRFNFNNKFRNIRPHLKRSNEFYNQVDWLHQLEIGDIVDIYMENLPGASQDWLRAMVIFAHSNNILVQFYGFDISHVRLINIVAERDSILPPGVRDVDRTRLLMGLIYQ